MSEDGEKQSGRSVPPRVREQVEAVKARYCEALAVGRFEPLVEYTAEDLVVMRQGSSPIEGLDAWQSLFDELMAEAPEYHAIYETEETIVRDDLVIERGICTEGPASGDGDYHEYNYLWMLRQTPAGTLEMTHNIYNQIS